MKTLAPILFVLASLIGCSSQSDDCAPGWTAECSADPASVTDNPAQSPKAEYAVQCFNLGEDRENCGSCGHHCADGGLASGFQCVAGQCQCVPFTQAQVCGPEQCGTETNGCGGTLACGLVCTIGSVCVGGSCQ